MLSQNRRFSSIASPLVPRLLTAKEAPAVRNDDRLYQRLRALGETKGTVASAINEYIIERKTVKKFELEACIKELRRCNRYGHALEIMDWMEAQNFKFSHSNYDVRLDLISRTKGIAAVENYFNGLSPSTKLHCTYTALQNCYCERNIEKALYFFSKMLEENMISQPFLFNSVMHLYGRLGQPEKVVTLVEEMKKIDVRPDIFTYNLLINSYSSLDDITGTERVFEEMKRENVDLCNWTTYNSLANAYIRAGDHDKARLALKELENEMPRNDCKPYHFLIALYAKISDLENVHRVWMSLKSGFRVLPNRSYHTMLRALANLGNVHELKKCYEEWESVCHNYDMKLANTAIRAFLQHGMVEEAESALKNAIARSKGPFFVACEFFMVFFLRNNQIKEALQLLEMVASKARDNEWRPMSGTMNAFTKFFKKKRDVSSTEEFYKLMKRIDHVDEHVYKSLHASYASAGATVPDMRERITRDGIEVTSELERLLARVCPKP